MGLVWLVWLKKHENKAQIKQKRRVLSWKTMKYLFRYINSKNKKQYGVGRGLGEKKGREGGRGCCLHEIVLTAPELRFLAQYVLSGEGGEGRELIG